MVLTAVGSVFPRNNPLGCAREKWWAVFKWALGTDALALQK